MEGWEEQEEEKMLDDDARRASHPTPTTPTHPPNFGHNATATESNQLFFHLTEEHREEVKETGTLY